ncbi:hypothetical protein F511_35770, partial [Dorcoceras hygrometricum]
EPRSKVERLKGETEDSWNIGKEKVLKSSEFDDMFSDKASVFFECGFKGYLDQFRANDYSEEEHPASFLSMVGPWKICSRMERPDEDAPGADASTSPKDSPAIRLYLDFYIFCKILTQQ